jgi:hypothetical protein
MLLLGQHAQEWCMAQGTNLHEWATPGPRVLKTWAGSDATLADASVALYIHYSPSDRVSEMVLHQLREYRSHGFSIVFVSMCRSLAPEDLQRVQALAGLILLRRNYALDFGAWHDVIPLLRQLKSNLTELLLVNDSMCGPLRSMAGLFARFRAAGNGLFGLTENLAPRPHLQSYFLLARGHRAVADLMRFVGEVQLTAYKRAIIRRGEIRLSRWMRERGHLVAVANRYERVEWLALQQPRARRRLNLLYPHSAGAASFKDWLHTLQSLPANPTHAFWYELVESCDFPFVKTEVLGRNPMRLPDIREWPQLVPLDRLRQIIEAHLRDMKKAPDTRNGGGGVRIARGLWISLHRLAGLWKSLCRSR